jgi:hypothetical protein
MGPSEGSKLYEEAVAGLKTWARRVRSIATIEEYETDRAYGLRVRPMHKDAKGFELGIGTDGRFDCFCGAIRCESDPMPPPLALARFCEAVECGRVYETEWLWNGRSMKLITEVRSDDDWQPRWRHTQSLLLRVPLRFCSVVEKHYQPYETSLR